MGGNAPLLIALNIERVVRRNSAHAVKQIALSSFASVVLGTQAEPETWLVHYWRACIPIRVGLADDEGDSRPEIRLRTMARSGRGCLIVDVPAYQSNPNLGPRLVRGRLRSVHY